MGAPVTSQTPTHECLTLNGSTWQSTTRARPCALPVVQHCEAEVVVQHGTATFLRDRDTTAVRLGASHCDSHDRVHPITCTAKCLGSLCTVD